METRTSELRRRPNLRPDIEGQTHLPNNRQRNLPGTLNSYFSPIYSFTCQVAQICRLIDTYKRRVFGLFFLVLEIGSAVLDGIGKGKLDLLLAAFVLSTIGFLITLCAYFKRRVKNTSTIEVPAVSQLRVVELVFSSIQLISSLLQLLLAHLKENKILDVKNNIDASVFSVAFAMVAVVFIFKNDEAITNSSLEDFQQPVKPDLTGTLARNQGGPSISSEDNLVISSPQRHMHPVEDSPALINSDESSGRTLFEPTPFEPLSVKVNRARSLRMRTNVTSKMTPTAPQISQQGFSWSFEDNHKEEEDYMNVSQVLEVYMADTDVQKPLDLLGLTGYEDLYKKVREMFNIDVEYLQQSKWILIFENDKGDLVLLGNYPWKEFTNHMRKIYIH